MAKLDDMSSKQDKLALSIVPLTSNFVRKYLYTQDKVTRVDRQPDFKNKLIEFYYEVHPDASNITCMFTEMLLPRGVVIGGHLFKSCWARDCKARLGFDDINDPRNGLLLFKPFEFAFDNSHICFQFDAQSEYFKMKILNTQLKDLTLAEYIRQEREIDQTMLLRSRDEWVAIYSKNPNVTDLETKMEGVDNLLTLLKKTFGSFEGCSLMPRSNGTVCYSRCLSFQAAMARVTALENGWITKDELESPSMFSELDDVRTGQLNSWLKDLTALLK